MNILNLPSTLFNHSTLFLLFHHHCLSFRNGPPYNFFGSHNQLHLRKEVSPIHYSFSILKNQGFSTYYFMHFDHNMMLPQIEAIMFPLFLHPQTQAFASFYTRFLISSHFLVLKPHFFDPFITSNQGGRVLKRRIKKGHQAYNVVFKKKVQRLNNG